MTKHRIYVSTIVVALLQFIFIADTSALPPEAARDKLLLVLAKQLEEEKYKDALGTFGKMDALKIELPATVDYFRGLTHYHLKNIPGAYDNFTRYIERAGSKGKFYQKSLEMLIELEPFVETERAMRKYMISGNEEYHRPYLDSDRIPSKAEKSYKYRECYKLDGKPKGTTYRFCLKFDKDRQTLAAYTETGEQAWSYELKSSADITTPVENIYWRNSFDGEEVVVVTDGCMVLRFDASGNLRSSSNFMAGFGSDRPGDCHKSKLYYLWSFYTVLTTRHSHDLIIIYPEEKSLKVVKYSDSGERKWFENIKFSTPYDDTEMIIETPEGGIKLIVRLSQPETVLVADIDAEGNYKQKSGFGIGTMARSSGKPAQGSRWNSDFSAVILEYENYNQAQKRKFPNYVVLSGENYPQTILAFTTLYNQKIIATDDSIFTVSSSVGKNSLYLTRYSWDGKQVWNKKLGISECSWLTDVKKEGGKYWFTVEYVSPLTSKGDGTPSDCIVGPDLRALYPVELNGDHPLAAKTN